MNILQPSRIESLDSRTIRVIDHSIGGVNEPWSFTAYPFDSILFLKQQIALHYGTRGYFPKAVFMAVKTGENEYRPLEFRWPFATSLLDPQHRTISKDLMEGDVRKPVFPTILAGVTLESMGFPSEVHIWSLPTVVGDMELTNTVVAGFVQLYFPLLETVADVEAFQGTSPLTDAEQQSLEAIRLFQEGRSARLAKLESLVSPTTPPTTIHELRALRILLPTAAIQDSLEILFHTMTPTRHLPILRYFSANQRTPPLLKLAMNPAGIPLLADAKLLRTLLGDAPAAEQGAMILGKAPLLHPKAPYGAAWILRIYEDGTAEVVLGAPRRDAPLSSEVVREAFQQLRGCLQTTPWKDVDIGTASLQELTATYKFTLQTEIRKPSKSELRKRAALFTPLFKEEAPLTGEAALGLRWKAVSNFAAERDPVMSYIADLFLKESLQSVDRIPVAKYVAGITREFGLGPTEAGAALTHWINRHAEYVLLDPDAPEKAVAKFGVGAAVSLYNHHPDYLFAVAGVDSYTDLRRIISMLEIWVSHTSQELATDAPTVAEEEIVGPAAPTAPAAPVVETAPEELDDVGQMDDWYQAMEMYGAMEEGEEGVGTEDATTAVQNVQPAPGIPKNTEAVLALEKDVRYPDPLGADEPPLAPLDEYLIHRLQSHDPDLFTYKTEKSTRLYSRTCQSSSNKQPNVMSPEAYRRIRSMYGDSVHWVEAPLSKYEIAALHFTSKAVGERVKEAKTLKKTLEEVWEYEKHMLGIGLPLKKDASVVSKWPQAPPGAAEEMEKLIAYQKSKPLWLVLRAGTNRANYYICAEYWCIRDDLPLIDAEFEGTTTRRGTSKVANTCPFCGGKEIRNWKAPAAGETVIRRDTTTKSETGVVARYVGFGPELFHPKGFVVPCCFTDPTSLLPPAESQPFPAPVVELPAAQQKGPKTPAAEKNAPTVELAPVRNTMEPFQDVRIKLDYVPAEFVGIPEDAYRFLDKEKTKVELRAKAIVRAYILSATSFPLEMGKVGLVSESMDAFFGQAAKDYLESPKHGKIYTHPKVRGQAFFRIGLGTKLRNIGAMMLNLVAYARAVVSHIIPPYQTAALTPEQMYTELFDTQEVFTFQAFQQANYGTLVAEFADPEAKPTPGQLQTWCGVMGIPLPAQRAYAEFLYGAWHRFKAYVADAGQRKDLRLWEHLFSAPGLFTATGVILAVVTTDENDHVILRCPTLGIAARHQSVRPPIMLVYEDRRTRIVEPLALYDGPERLLGVLDPDSVVFGQLAPALRTPLTAFYSEYFDPKTGCGRPQPVMYPWLEEDEPRAQTGIPRLGALLTVLRKMENTEARYLLRDRSQRLVGVVVAVAEVPLFVPALDDGTIDISLGSQYDVEALPPAPLAALLQFLVGPSLSDLTGLAKYFGGLLPVELRSQGRERAGGRMETMLVALETKSGCLIPLEPLKLDAVVAHPMMTQFRGSVQIDELPWQALAPVEDATLLHNPEEQLEEAYQHARLTLSEWLQSAEGRPYKTAIESLRASALPLYESRKRLDLLLQPMLARWIHVGKKGTTWDISTLRRNCLKVPKGKCEGACVWSNEDSCLIHAVPTDRYVDPVFVIGARIVDELLRTNEPALQVLTKSVARLRPPVGIVREKDSLLVSFEGRGDVATYQALGLEGRLPTRYTQGIVIPEELGSTDVGCEGSFQGIPLTWEGITHMVWPAEAVGQSLRDIAWAAMVGSAPAAQGELAFYKEVAESKGWTILFTRDTCHGYQLVGRITPQQKVEGERTFVILTPDRVPLGSAKTKQPRLMESELPSVIMGWLDEAPKEAKKAIEEVLEVEGEEAEEELPFAALEREEKAKERAIAPAPPADVKKDKKACPEGKERSPISGQCVKKCEPDEVRSEKGHCKKVRGAPVVVPAVAPAVVPAVAPQIKQDSIKNSINTLEDLVDAIGDNELEEVWEKAKKYINIKNPHIEEFIKSVDLLETMEEPEQVSAVYELITEFVEKQIPTPPILPEPGFGLEIAEVCPAPLEVSSRSGKCVLPCKEGQLRNPSTGHCIKVGELPDENIAKYDIARCAKSKGQSAAFPFKKEDVLEALKEQGIKARKSWHMEELCSHVTKETLRILARKRTRKNKNKSPEVLAVPAVAPAPIEVPEVPEVAPAAPAASPEPNMTNIDIGLCPKGQSMRFPFKREELLDSLREDKVYLARSSTLAKICPHVTQETLRRILKRRGNTRKNVRSN